jgi:hypothetical protein
MAGLVVVVKNKEEQGTTMLTNTTDGQVPTGVCG